MSAVTSYTINSGDCLWNIAKSNYKCESDKQIEEVVNMIAKENNISNPDLIYAGASINLPQTDEFIKSDSGADTKKAEDKKAASDDKSKKAAAKTENKADKFDSWTNDESNYEKSLNGQKVDDFEMFDFDASTYSKDLKNFAQDYIDKYDADKDGEWNEAEFTNMAAAETDISKDSKNLFSKLFKALNLDKNEKTVNAGEFASFLYMADLDLDKYMANDFDVASAIDGKVDYTQYQTFSSLLPNDDGYDTLYNQKKAFFDNYYA